MPIVQARTGAVAYEEQGAGMPLVLLHANPGDLHHFDGIIATLWAKLYLKRRTPLVKEIIERIDKGRTLPARVAVDAAVWRSFSQPEHDLRAPARQIVAPTLLIYGRYDPAIRFKQDGRNAQAAIAHAQLVVLPTGHEPFAEDPEAFLQALEPFLQAVSAQRNFHGTSNSSSAD